MRVDELPDFLKAHWLAIKEQSCTTRRAGSLMKAPRGGPQRGERA
jgi:hypothetical protein